MITRPEEWVNQTAYHLFKTIPQTPLDTIKFFQLLKCLIRPGNKEFFAFESLFTLFSHEYDFFFDIVLFSAMINASNQHGETLLHEAAFRGNLVALNFCLDCGASVAIKTKYVLSAVSQSITLFFMKSLHTTKFPFVHFSYSYYNIETFYDSNKMKQLKNERVKAMYTFHENENN
jgi:hypothetical protein